jgi:hypothetical protein
MDFGKAIGFPFEDEDWLTKLGLAFVLLFVPFANIAVIGWQYKLAQNVKRGEERPLPAWDDFGDYFMKGLLFIVAGFLYQIPVILFGCVAWVVSIASTGTLAGVGGDDAAAAAGSVFVIVMACCGCLIFLYAIVAWIVLTGGYVRFLETETFGTFMEFGTNFSLVRNNLSQFLMAAVYYVIGGAIPIVNIYFPFHIIGQLAQQLEEGGALSEAAV